MLLARHSNKQQHGVILPIADLSLQSHPRKSLYQLLKLRNGLCLIYFV